MGTRRIALRDRIALVFVVLSLLLLGSPPFVQSTRRTVAPHSMPVSSPTSVLAAPTPEDSNPASSPMKSTGENSRMIITNPRSCILQVGVSAGRLCGVANSHLLDENGSQSRALVLAMTDLLRDLHRASQSLNLNIVRSIHTKLELNNRKYPVSLCKVGRYSRPFVPELSQNG